MAEANSAVRQPKDDVEFELHKHQMAPARRKPPRVLDFDDITEEQATQTNASKYRLSDLVITLLFYAEGIDALKTLLTDTADVNYKGFRQCDVRPGHGWGIDCQEREIEFCIYSPLTGESELDDIPNACQQMWVRFDMLGGGVWKPTSCFGIWASRVSRNRASIYATSVLIGQFIIEEVALIVADRNGV